MEKIIIDKELESETETESEEIDSSDSNESDKTESDKSDILPEIPEIPETETDNQIDNSKKQPIESNLPPEPTNECSSKKQKLIWCLIGLIGVVIVLGICLIKIL